MELKNMTMADIEAREAEMKAQIESAESEEQLEEIKESLTEERKLLNEKKAELKDLAERKAIAQKIQENNVTPEVIEERKEDITMKDIKEYRNSKEYMNAYAEYIKSGDDTEVRSLLTTNVGDAGSVAVPSIIEDGIKTAWEASEILNYVRTINVKGNYQVQFEVSGSDAVIHYEGSGAVDEEELVLGIVEIIPRSIKKWISVTDEVLDMRGEEFLNYIKDELSYRIIKKAEEILIAAIDALPTTATASAPCVKTVKSAPTGYVIADAIGNLSADVRGGNTVIVINPLTYKEFRKVQVTAGYGIDVFEGKKVIFSDAIKAYDAASENDTYALVGDFSYGARAVTPNGKSVQIKVDDKSAMKSDLVDVLGRMPIGLGVVACKAFTRITKPAAI